VPRTGLDPAVRARIDAFAAAHGITVVESDPTTWPEKKPGVDATALSNAVAPPPVLSVVRDHDGRTTSITGDLFSVPADAMS